MARRSARLASSQGSETASSPPHKSSPTTGTKRKAEPGESPSAKRGKKDEKEQKTIEESMNLDRPETEQATTEKEDVLTRQDQKEREAEDKQAAAAEEKQDVASETRQANGDSKHETDENDISETKEEVKQQNQIEEPKPEVKDATEVKESEREDKQEGQKQQQSESAEPTTASNGGDAVESHARDADVPSSILEKGIVYFLYRGRVNIDDPKNVSDIARSYLVLRPLPHGAKLSDGPIGDEKNCRLIAIPKKTLPVTGQEKWTAFVEKANVSFDDLKKDFLASNNYETATQGSQHTPATSPAAEGIYAITTTGRESHIAYIVTLPTSLGEVQKDLGLRERGSFIVSVKNPKAPGPANADLGRDPGYSQELLNDFRSLRWAPLKAEHLNYESCQFLMIGEGEGIDKATAPQNEDQEKDKTEPKDEMEKLEGEDEIRVKHLNGEDAVFADLGTDSKNYPGMQTTW